MIRSSADPVQERLEALDVVRGIALFAVLIVNLSTAFRVSIFQQFLDVDPQGSHLDRLLAHMVSAALEMKAFALFSLLFGVGLAIQFDRLALRGRPLLWLVRRLLALLAFGLIHLLFIWNGDILTEYAIVGLLVLPLLYLPTRLLFVAALISLIIYVAHSSMPWSIQWPSTMLLAQHISLANEVYSTASYAEIVQFGQSELPLLLPLHLYVLPRTISLFLFGMFLWRTGLFTRPAKFLVRLRIVAALGVLGGTAIMVTAEVQRLSEWLMHIAQILLTFGYGATILVLMEYSVPRNLLKVLAPLGRMAFTNYLIQSLICSFIFFGYGFGQFGHMAVAPALALAVAIYLIQVAWSRYWLRDYQFGPLEWLWRTLMYGKMQPMRNLEGPNQRPRR